MKRQEMKRTLKNLAKPIKKELFQKLEYTEEELALMKYLYLDNLEQWWIADELGISIPTLNIWHRNCINQLISYFNFEKYKYDNGEINEFIKYFGGKNV